MTTQRSTTHELYLHAVRDLVIAHAVERRTIDEERGERLAHTKLLYGVGDGTYRGVTMFDAWQNGVGRVDIVEIAAARAPVCASGARPGTRTSGRTPPWRSASGFGRRPE